MPAYTSNRLAALFFIAFVCVGTFFLMNYQLAVVYSSYSAEEKALRAEAVARRERSLERVGQACENSITDQSVLNGEFRGGCSDYRAGPCATLAWRPLPLSYNVNVQMLANTPEDAWAGAQLAVVHFAGSYAKPWLTAPQTAPTPERRAALAREGQWRERWRRACKASEAR